MKIKFRKIPNFDYKYIDSVYDIRPHFNGHLYLYFMISVEWPIDDNMDSTRFFIKDHLKEKYSFENKI